MIIHYIKISIRQILKNKTQYILSTLGIAVGILCFSMTDYGLDDKDNGKRSENYEYMANFYTREEGKGDKQYSGNIVYDMNENPVNGIEKIALYKTITANVSFENKKDQSNAESSIYEINKDFLQVYSVKNEKGETLDLQQGNALVSETHAKYMYGDENPIGKTITIEHKTGTSTTYTDFTISGVFTGNGGINFITLFEKPISPEDNLIQHTLLLSPDASIKEINKELENRYPPTEGKKYVIHIKKQSDTDFDYETFVIKAILLFIAALILISAMINFLKFSIQTYFNRTKELSLRISFGSNSINLFLLLFTEVLLVLLFVILITYFLTSAFLPLFHTYFQSLTGRLNFVNINYMDLYIKQIECWSYLFIISVLVCCITIARVKQINIITGIKIAGRKNYGLRNFFLGFQIFVCFLFTGVSIATILITSNINKKIYRSLSDEECKKILNFELSEYTVINHADVSQSVDKSIKNEIISQLNGLSNVQDILLFGKSGTKTINLKDNKELKVNLRITGDNYYKFMNLPIKGHIPASENEAVVSNYLMALLGDNTNTVEVDGKVYSITGTFDKIPFGENFLTETPSVITKISENADEWSSISVKFFEGQEKELKEEIENILVNHMKIPNIKSLYYDNFLKYGFFEIAKDISLLLSIISLLITALGIYSAISLETRQRQKEVAIRKINGADKNVIIRLFAKLYVKLLAISAFIALSIIFVLFKNEYPSVLSNPILWIATLAIVCLIVLLSIFWHINRISKINPAEIIKSE